MIKYSLIVPHYNDAFRLGRLLKSLPQRDDFQVIVVDDCSPDQEGLGAVKQQFGQVFFLSAPSNQGAGSARNIGLRHAKGQFILFADADDEFLPNAFNVLDQELKSDIDIAFFLAEAWQEESNKPSVRADPL